MEILNPLKSLAVAGAMAVAFLAGTSDEAEAAVLITDGGSYAISTGSEFFGEVDAGAGGAGEWNVEFVSSIDPLAATASATIGGIVSNQFTDLMMSWIGADGVTVLNSVAVVPLLTELGTSFTVPNLTQTLRLSWSASTAGAGFDVEVSAVPLPAAGLVLLTALGGAGMAYRRRKSAVS